MIIIKTTSDSKRTLKDIANKLLNKKLISCANIFEGIVSIYIWENNIKEEKEFMMLIKTFKNKEKKVFKLIKDNHNYEIPEILSIKVDSTDNNYYQWMQNTIKND